MQTLQLTQLPWTLQAVGDVTQVPAAIRDKAIPATVPGCVHTDLMAAGLLEDPYLADNELRQYWIGDTSWRYACRFNLDAAFLEEERLELACDGLDTIATVELNGQPLGEAKNMHVAHRFDLKGAARAGENELVITFAAPVPYAKDQEKVFHGLPNQGGGGRDVLPHNMIRKMACNMGWDWGPVVPTCGIWRPIRVEAWKVARIDHVRPLVKQANHERATVLVHVDVTRAAKGGKYRVEATLRSPEGHAEVTGDSPLTFTVARPRLWWPVGHGEQPLYELEVRLVAAASGEVVSRWHRRIGLRTAELEVEADPATVGEPVPDARGESMRLKVNGKPIYCKGANWIPDDCFPSRITRDDYRERITQARDANMNMLRVWGGGIYEDDAFYETCDELGIMVWQDFLFACACYPEEAPYCNLVEEEARYNVARLASYASLVAWNGCNENIWGTFDWGDKWRAVREEGTCTWGLGYYLDLLPRVVREVDPSKPYWPGSPYSGSMDRHPNLNEYGNRHIWDVWHGAGQYRNYLGHYPRMATEFGYHGPPTWPTLARAIPESERQWHSAMMLLHNKNGRDGQIQTRERMADDFVPPDENFDDSHYLAQIMQARALSMGIEWFRALYPWNAGALYWQLNDCYPVSSWSAIDGDGRPKPLWYSSRRFFAPRLVTIKPRKATSLEQVNDALAVYFHNDHDEAWQGRCTLRQLGLDGSVIAEHGEQVKVEPRGIGRFLVPEAMHGRRDCLLVAEMPGMEAEGGARALWWFAPDKELDYPEPALDAELVRTDQGYRLTLTAETILRDVCLYPDRIDPEATVSDQCVTLLPGEKATFDIHTQARLTKEQLLAPPVLNCANRFGAATPAAV